MQRSKAYTTASIITHAQYKAVKQAHIRTSTLLSYNYNKAIPSNTDLTPAKQNTDTNSGTVAQKLRIGSYDLNPNLSYPSNITETSKQSTRLEKGDVFAHLTSFTQASKSSTKRSVLARGVQHYHSYFNRIYLPSTIGEDRVRGTVARVSRQEFAHGKYYQVSGLNKQERRQDLNITTDLSLRQDRSRLKSKMRTSRRACARVMHTCGGVGAATWLQISLPMRPVPGGPRGFWVDTCNRAFRSVDLVCGSPAVGLFFRTHFFLISSCIAYYYVVAVYMMFMLLFVLSFDPYPSGAVWLFVCLSGFPGSSAGHGGASAGGSP
ncbi:beta-glucosidase 2-like [Dorcoceras hygrometricum]|uniref:Beta-glucosidase 2-like n=1 Tax=Dorcoceras hygrometricum TaxID=472368 RepID=A0A2Z7DDS3_9LAMI|nr:beta-glucosidase 2-like [Dorcoceras hygrometricum]